MLTYFEEKEAHITVLTKYWDWVVDLRNHLIKRISRKVSDNFRTWSAVENDLWEEKKKATVASRRNKSYEGVVSRAVDEELKTIGMDIKEFRNLLLMYDDSISMFHRYDDDNKVMTPEASKANLDKIKFPKDMCHLKEPLRKAVSAVANYDKTEFGIV